MFTRFVVAAFAAAAMLSATAVRADLITNDLGDRGDGYTLLQFYYNGTGGNSGSWTVPAGVTSVEVLLVGGGGAGARGGAFGGPSGGSPGGGAGGSGVIYVAYQVPEPSTYALVGAVSAAALLLRRRVLC